MFNPFRTRVPVGTFNPAASGQPNSGDIAYIHNTIDLDDPVYADQLTPPYRGAVGDIVQGDRPAYAGEDKRVLVYQPDALPGYNFLSPAPGSTDLSMPRDFNSVPGTSQLNYMEGPVTGSAMDVYQTGNRQVLASTPPGQYGPVVGGDDYSQIVSNATFQQAFAEYSNAPSDQAIVSAI